MACPGACSFGGGQPAGATIDRAKNVHANSGTEFVLDEMVKTLKAPSRLVFSAEWKSLGSSSIKW